MDNLDQTLQRLFNKHRIVFWYDEKGELHQEYNELWLTGIEKLELSKNAFSLKHHILREAPIQKFLIYHPGPQPPDLENWLLDVQLAQGVFHADQLSLWLVDAGLVAEHWDLAQEHAGFFREASRRAALRLKLPAQDTPNQIRLKMLAACVGEGVPPRLEDILEKLLADLAHGDEENIEAIRQSELDGFFWDQLRRSFGYQSKIPGLRDFAMTLFQACYAAGLGEKASLNQEALVFLHRWKDSLKYQKAFEMLSGRCAADLNIEADLAKRPLEPLLEMDYFKLIDQRILSELVRRVTERTLPAAECSRIVRRRRTAHWFAEYQDIYAAIDYAARFQAELERAELSVNSLADGVQKYTHTWFQLDQLYRKYIYHARASRQVSLLESLSTQVENLYTNNYLLAVNNSWQAIIDACQAWDAAPFIMQREFFERAVRGQISNQRKLAVVISDGLRYEIGAELMAQVCAEDRFEATLEPLVSELPSFTQLGMAALLPHEKLTLNGDGTVLVDGQSASGVENRGKILNAAVPGSTALRAKDFSKMTKDDTRALFRDHQVVYIYHNQIDAVGDKRETEERVFDAVEETLVELVEMIKKLANANYTAILVTGDHGFIYQNRPLEESDFSGIEVSGEDVQYRHRRFVLGIGLLAAPNIKKFHASQLGLQGDLEVAIPKSIHRLRLKGSGSRYVHGGAALQEVVIPLIQIRKKRESDVNLVEVDILRSTPATISTGQLTVSFYQDQPVTAKLQERRLRAGIYAKDGELLSDQHELIFDLTSENPRQREIQERFILSRKADAYNEQEVVLKLEEPVPGTTYYKEYKTARYLLRRSFTSDFDF